MKVWLVLALVAFALAGAAVALWVSGKLPFVSASDVAPSAADSDGGAAADASARPFKKQTGPLSSAQLGAPLVNGAWITACGAPDTMKVTVKLDVRQGRAVKVDVKTEPTDPVVIGCVERAASDLRWDISPKTDHVTVRY